MAHRHRSTRKKPTSGAVSGWYSNYARGDPPCVFRRLCCLWWSLGGGFSTWTSWNRQDFRDDHRDQLKRQIQLRYVDRILPNVGLCFSVQPWYQTWLFGEQLCFCTDVCSKSLWAVVVIYAGLWLLFLFLMLLLFLSLLLFLLWLLFLLLLLLLLLLLYNGSWWWSWDAVQYAVLMQCCNSMSTEVSSFITLSASRSLVPA